MFGPPFHWSVDRVISSWSQHKVGGPKAPNNRGEDMKRAHFFSLILLLATSLAVAACDNKKEIRDIGNQLEATNRQVATLEGRVSALETSASNKPAADPKTLESRVSALEASASNKPAMDTTSNELKTYYAQTAPRTGPNSWNVTFSRRVQVLATSPAQADQLFRQQFGNNYVQGSLSGR